MNLLILAIAFISCGSNPDSSSSDKAESTNTIESEVSAEDNPIIYSYLKLKDYLVETDAENARTAAVDFLKTVEQRPIENLNEMARAAELIANTEDVEEQRAHFETISEILYEYVKTHDTGIKLYRQFCPMAFNDRGAYWLSTETKIMNPYFGDVMLHCGSVKEEI